MRSRRNHLGTGFEVWTGDHIWFWLVVKTQGDGGIFGAAATEAAAVREACLSIEQMSAQSRASAANVLITSKNAPSPSCHYDSFSLAGWESLLANLERYLKSVCPTAA